MKTSIVNARYKELRKKYDIKTKLLKYHKDKFKDLSIKLLSVKLAYKGLMIINKKVTSINKTLKRKIIVLFFFNIVLISWVIALSIFLFNY